MCLSVCYKLNAGPVECGEFREVQQKMGRSLWTISSNAQVASRWPIPGQLIFNL